MHELALARSLIQIIEDEAVSRTLTKIDAVIIEIGALSCVDPHALEFSFDAVARGTVAAGARLEIQTPPGRARCFACEAEVDITARGDSCPACGSHQLFVMGGDDMIVKSMEAS